MGGCGFALLVSLLIRFYTYRLSKMVEPKTEIERKQASTRLIIAATFLTGLAAALVFLTARHGTLLKHLFGHGS